MIPLSPGLVHSCVELLRLGARREVTFGDVVRSFARMGVMSTSQVVATIQEIGWMRANDRGRALPTIAGTRLLELDGPEAQLRQAILDFIDVQDPIWIQEATFGRRRLLRFVTPSIRQVFAEAGLIESTERDVVRFWDNLAGRARGQRDDRLLAIGREGERLTFDYEKARTGREPKWIALENNQDGYDVLSVVASNDTRQLSIEVKASRAGTDGYLYLTANEWERATNGGAHLFHLWDMGQDPPALAEISTDQLCTHIPSNVGAGEWDRSRVPFAVFAGHFRQVRA